MLAAGPREQVHLGAGEVDVGGQQSHPARVDDRVVGLHPLQQHVVQRRRALLGLEAEGEGEAGLGVEVDEEHPLAEIGERQADGLGRRGLGDAAFLVGDREHPRHGPESTEPGVVPAVDCDGAAAPRDQAPDWAERPIGYSRVPFVTSLTQWPSMFAERTWVRGMRIHPPRGQRSAAEIRGAGVSMTWPQG